MVASAVNFDLEEQKLRIENEMMKPLSLQMSNHKIEEIRVFECLHGYHRRCIDSLQDKKEIVVQNVDDNFFD